MNNRDFISNNLSYLYSLIYNLENLINKIKKRYFKKIKTEHNKLIDYNNDLEEFLFNSTTKHLIYINNNIKNEQYIIDFISDYEDEIVDEKIKLILFTTIKNLILSIEKMYVLELELKGKDRKDIFIFKNVENYIANLIKIIKELDKDNNIKGG